MAYVMGSRNGSGKGESGKDMAGISLWVAIAILEATTYIYIYSLVNNVAFEVSLWLL